MTAVSAGTLLAGKYRLERVIGRGGMGSVWRAEHLGLSAPVAVKVLNLTEIAPTPEALQRFHREARAAASVRSPHVVQVLDHGVDETLNAPFIVMELLEGESLAQRLKRVGRLSPEETMLILTHVARALARAHEAGIVHRDLKPDNVFLVQNEEEVVAKVVDFGIAKSQVFGLDGEAATRTGAVMGTAYYMSPEQISGSRNLDLRTDLWAFAVMACECLTGQRPFMADSIGGLTLVICLEPVRLPSSLAPVPAGFDAWFLRAVNRDPKQRFDSAREAAEALRTALAIPSDGQRSSISLPPEASGSMPPLASTVTTGVPFSIKARALPAPVPAPPKRRMPWLAGGAALLLGVGALWLTRGIANDHSTGAPSASPSEARATAPQQAVVPPSPAPAPTPLATQASPAPITPVGPKAPSPSVAALKSIAHPAAKRPAAKPAPMPEGAPPAAAVPAAPPVAVPPAERDVLDDRH